MSKLRVAIIGAGSIAKRHINALQANPQAEIACICDRNEARVQVMAGEFGLANYCTDYMDILRDESVDAVSILTPTFTHKDIVLAALNHGKHVLCEKPPALNVQEVQECVDAAARSGKLLMYAFVRRFNKVVTFLKDYIATGAMGDIYYAEVARMERCNKLAGWFVNKDCAGGGKLMDACVHQIIEVAHRGQQQVIGLRAGTVDAFAAGEMAVRVDKAGHDGAARSVVDGGVFGNGVAVFAADVYDALALHGNKALFDGFVMNGVDHAALEYDHGVSSFRSFHERL